MDQLQTRLDALEQRTHTVERQLRWWRGLACGLLGLAVLTWALPVGTAQEDTGANSEKEKKTLEQRVAALESLLKHFSRKGNDVRITGANLHIRNGLGRTDCGSEEEPIPDCPNGLGNLIVGYNEPRGGEEDIRTGSHNVVVGQQHNFSRFGGIVVGIFNEISGRFASVSSGSANTASGDVAVVIGGFGNIASGGEAVVSGGAFNTASGGADSSVSGGFGNTASGFQSSVSGGLGNTASGQYSAVSGGAGNTASGFIASVSGGAENTASGGDPDAGDVVFVGGAVSGGFRNTASGTFSVVSGGSNNTASGDGSVVSGGGHNPFTGEGAGNTASGMLAVVSGGQNITQETAFGWSAGSEGNEVVVGNFRSP